MDLSRERMRTLASVLDLIIPPSLDGRLPGAGELGLGMKIAAAAASQSVIETALESLETKARERGASGFSTLASDARQAVLDEVARDVPTLMPELVAQSIVGYYQDMRVWEAIGLEPRPPYPDGYALPDTDLSILDGVRKRPPFYREP
jgi:hypothetical protein